MREERELDGDGTGLLILKGKQARRQDGGGTAVVELVHGQKEKEEENKRQHILHKTP